MEKLLRQLLDKRFSVYVGDEFERITNFIGLMKLFGNYSDFFEYNTILQKNELKKWLKVGEIYIDANIYVKIIN